MVYLNHFSVAVKVNGKILREQSNLVTLPFGSEYTILLKNLNSRRAMVKVSVDGQDATEGTRLILAPSATVELERFIRNGNLASGNRFKFVERTAGIEAHRGIKEDDGLIRAEFWAEKQVAESIETIIRRHYIDHYEDLYPPHPWYPRPYPYPRPFGPGWRGGPSCSTGSARPGGSVGASRPGFGARSSGPSRSMHSSRTASALSANMKAARGRVETERGGMPNVEQMMTALNDAGITVPGSESQQKFHNVSGFPLESNSHVIVLNLRGEVAGKPVAAPVTVDRKPVCVTCGKTNKPQDKFCRECGTALELL